MHDSLEFPNGDSTGQVFGRMVPILDVRGLVRVLPALVPGLGRIRYAPIVLGARKDCVHERGARCSSRVRGAGCRPLMVWLTCGCRRLTTFCQRRGRAIRSGSRGSAACGLECCGARIVAATLSPKTGERRGTGLAWGTRPEALGVYPFRAK